MEMPPDRFGELKLGLQAQSGALAGGPALDWHGLTARLVAAHAARDVLNPPPRRPDPNCGSFAPGTARDLARWRAIDSQPALSSPGVNLDAKADGKPARAISSDSAGDDRRLFEGAYDR